MAPQFRRSKEETAEHAEHAETTQRQQFSARQKATSSERLQKGDKGAFVFGRQVQPEPVARDGPCASIRRVPAFRR
jgi:hypothetical protein